jgi:hypothetical protein
MNKAAEDSLSTSVTLLLAPFTGCKDLIVVADATSTVFWHIESWLEFNNAKFMTFMYMYSLLPEMSIKWGM